MLRLILISAIALFTIINPFLLAQLDSAPWSWKQSEVKQSVEDEKELKLFPFSLHESFEKKDPFMKWASDGKYRIHYKGLSTEKASSGKKSFKIDITFETASYVYFAIPVNIPTMGHLNFEGDILVSKVSNAKAALGTNNSLFPCRRSGVNILKKESISSNEWKTQRSDLVEAALTTAQGQTYYYIAEATHNDVGIWTNKIGLYLFGKPGGSITVYVDNITIKGLVPELKEYYKFTEDRWKSYQIDIKKRVDKLRIDLAGYMSEEVDAIFTMAKRKGFFSRKNFKKLIELKEDRDHLHHNQSLGDFSVFLWNPTSGRNILPHTHPVPSYQTNNLKLAACSGEYEPISFILRTRKDVENIRIKVSDFEDKNGNKISKNTANIKYVKCWYQAGDNHLFFEKGKKHLTPELLLKDDALIKVDHRAKKNYLKASLNGVEKYIDITDPNAKLPKNAKIKDASDLVPLNIKKNTNKQVWITVHVPDDAKPGNYTGVISITAENIEARILKLNLEVLEFNLPDPVLEYSIYYTGRLVNENNSQIGSKNKNATQYKIEMLDLKNHGIESATLYQRFGPQLEPALQIRNETNMNNGNLYVLGTWTGNPTDVKGIEKLTADVEKWMYYKDKFNYEKAYIYGIDEGNSYVIKSQRKAWQAVHNSGAGILVACPKTAYHAADGLLSIAVLPKELDPDIAHEWHNTGAKVFSYGNPQVGFENAGIYRRNYGLDLWLAGYDGAMNFAYQYQMGAIWNDFDHPRYRDHVFTYPATNSIIDTIQWQGFREAVDDVRYLKALMLEWQIPENELKNWLLNFRQLKFTQKEIRDQIIYKIQNLRQNSN